LSQAVVLPLLAGKRAQTKLANRQAILDAGRQVFAESGYEAVSVRDIIRRTGLSVGAFYNYFRSKEEVYQALADDGARRFKLILREEYARAGDFADFLKTALRAFFTFQVAEHKAAGLMERPPAAHPVIRVKTPEQEAVFEEVRVVLAEVIERGLAPRVDADYLAAACIGVALEVCDRMLSRRPIDVDAATDFAMDMILGGMAAAAGRPTSDEGP
jgi:AcrR family transcriptional regulator